jgi:DNA replication protein DnaC
MLIHPTLDQLRQLGLAGMAQAFEELQANPRGGELAPAEWLGLLLDREIAERQDRRLKARLRFAKLRHQASIEDIDWRAARGLDRALFQKLAQGGWIEAKENLILEGPTSVGKSWLACALGQKACRGLEPLGPDQQHDLLELAEDRYGRGATLITSQVPVACWTILQEPA